MQQLANRVRSRLTPRRYRDYGYTEIAKSLYYRKKMESKLPLEGIRALEATFQNEEVIYTKYLDYKDWMPATLRRAIHLGLDKKTGLNILDIGTGPGYFPWICQFFGHQARSLDIDNHAVFNGLVDIIHIHRTVFRIKKFEPLATFDIKFDLVTAFMANFCRDADGRPWDSVAWRFFLNNVASEHMKRSGRLVMTLNRHYDGQYLDNDVESCFNDLGATITGRWVTFADMGKLMAA